MTNPTLARQIEEIAKSLASNMTSTGYSIDAHGFITRAQHALAHSFDANDFAPDGIAWHLTRIIDAGLCVYTEHNPDKPRVYLRGVQQAQFSASPRGSKSYALRLTHGLNNERSEESQEAQLRPIIGTANAATSELTHLAFRLRTTLGALPGGLTPERRRAVRKAIDALAESYDAAITVAGGIFSDEV